jgi:hypothetical protein
MLKAITPYFSGFQKRYEQRIDFPKISLIKSYLSLIPSLRTHDESLSAGLPGILLKAKGSFPGLQTKAKEINGTIITSPIYNW